MTTARTRLLSTDVHAHALDLGDDDPRTGLAALTTLGDTGVGLWEIEPGTAHDTEVDEVFVVLSGRGTVAFEDGTTVDLVPGVAVRLHAGDRTTWTVTETLRKVYVSV